MNYNNLINKEYYDLTKDSLECKIHCDVLINPIQCQNESCEYNYCKKCVDQLPKSPDKSIKCPNCQQSAGFSTKGTKNVLRMLDNLSFTCEKCTKNFTYSGKPHYCFYCWRCSKPFTNTKQLCEHVKECDPNPDQHYNKQLKGFMSEIYNLINQMNRKVNFVFGSIWTVLENNNLTNGFESYNYDYKHDKISKFYRNIGKQNEHDYVIRSEFISELDLRFLWRIDKLELFDCYNNKKIGEVEIDRQIENISYSPSSLIDQYIDLKNKNGIEREEGVNLDNWMNSMLQLIATALPVPIEPYNPLRNLEIKPYGTGTLEIIQGNIKKTSGSSWDTLVRVEKPLREGIHEFKVRINKDDLSRSGIFIGFADEINIHPSSYNHKFIGIYSYPDSGGGKGLNRHHKEWKTRDGDIIDAKIDFNRGTIEFYLEGSIIADANVKKFDSSNLYLAIYLFHQENSVSILEYNFI